MCKFVYNQRIWITPNGQLITLNGLLRSILNNICSSKNSEIIILNRSILMEVKLSDNTSGKLIFNNVYPKDFDVGNSLAERNHQIKTTSYNIHIIENWYEGTHISVVNIDALKSGEILLEHPNQLVAFLFCLEGSLICRDKSNNDIINLSKNEQSITLGGFNNLIISFTDHTQYIYIQLTKTQYKKLTGSNFVDDITAFKASEIDSEINLVLYDLINQRNQNRVKRIFLEAQIYQLLTFYINKAEQKTSISLKKDDIVKILHAKELVEKNMQFPHSLIELSRKAGINDNKLKKGFKELTGETVFGYLNKIRMEKAYYYLSKEKKNVNEVAFLVGYKNAQHFTIAFKKRYNILPGRINKTKFFNANM